MSQPQRGNKTFWEWLLDKYGIEEAKRRYELWKKAK
jgi:hypothetical protein